MAQDYSDRKRGGVGRTFLSAAEAPARKRRCDRILANAVPLSLGLAIAGLLTPTARADVLTWDANNTGPGLTDGAGEWLAPGQWFDGTNNVTWVSGSDAVFGVGGVGDVVTLSAPTTANTVNFNAFTGTYTLGTAGTALTVNNGITLNAGAGAVTFVSPIALGGSQNWANNSAGLLTVDTVTNVGDAAPFVITVNGSGTGGTTFGGIISNGGATGTTGLTVNTTGGTTILSAANTYSGDTTLTAGVLQGTTSTFSATPGSPFGTSILRLNGGTLQLRTGGTTGGPAGNVTAQTVTFGNSVVVGGTTTIDVNRTTTATAATTKTLALGTLSIGANTLNVTGGNSFALTFGATTLTGNATFNVNGAGSATVTGLTLGAVNDGGNGFGITKTGPSQLAIIAASTYSGTTTIEEGNLGPSNAAALGTSTTPVALGTANTIANNLSPSLLIGGATTIARNITVGSSNAPQTSGVYTIGTGNVGSAATLNGTITLNQNLTVAAATSNSTFTLGVGGITSGSTGTQTVTFNNSNTVASSIIVSGVIGGGPGTIALTKALGAGATVLTAANTYTGPTTINVGVLRLGNGGTTGSLSTSSTILDNGNFAINRSNAVTQGTDFNGAGITGSGSFTQAGTGTTTLNAANTYTGGTVVTGGTLTLVPGGTLGATTGALTVSNANTAAATNVVLNLLSGVDTTVGSLSGTIAAAVPVAPANTATINNGGAGTNLIVNQTTANLTYAGVIAGAGNLVLGSLSTATVGLGGANTYTGTTTIESGGITASNAAALGNSTSAIALGSATTISNNLSPTLQVNGNTTVARNITVGASNAPQASGIYTIGSGNGSSVATLNSAVTLNQNVSVTSAGGAFTLAGSVVSGTADTRTVTLNDTGALTASTVIGGGVGTIALAKTGAGTATLTGANTYTGGTTVNVGTLTVGTNGTLGAASGALAVNNPNTAAGTTVTLNLPTAVDTAVGNLSGAVATPATGANAARIVTSAGRNLTVTQTANATFAGVIAGPGTLTKAGASTLTLTGANAYTGTTTVMGGTLLLSSDAQTTYVAAPTVVDITGAGARFVLDYTGTTSPVGQIKTILDAGYAGNFATSLIRSSTATATRGLGYGDNGTAVTVMATIYGDANLDGVVNFNDFLVLQANFSNTGTRFDQGNFNYDGQTDFNDFLVLQSNFGSSVNGMNVAVTSEQVSIMNAFFAAENTAVPEPALFGLLGVTGVAVLGRRRNGQ